VHDRMVQTCLLAAALVVLVGLVKPTPRDPLRAAEPRESRFYLHKGFNDDVFDVVVLGDSRALRGVAPGEMTTELDSLRIFNFAFNAGGLNPEMYRAGERLLDPHSVHPAIVLAVTPLTLLDWKAANGQYNEVMSTPRDEIFVKKHFPSVVEFFAPLQPADVVTRVFHIPPLFRYYQEFHRSGWIESHKEPADTTEALGAYAESLAGSRVDSDLVAAMEDQVRQWTGEGIAVFAFRPPTQVSMERLEDELLDFHEGELARRIEAAGGRWLDFPARGYRTYDGSHLVAESAREFSRDLARAMERAWPAVEASAREH